MQEQATVYRCRSRHSHYKMTAITTVRQNALLRIPPCGSQTLAINLWGPETAFSLNLTTGLTREEGEGEAVHLRLCVVAQRRSVTGTAVVLVHRSDVDLQAHVSTEH